MGGFYLICGASATQLVITATVVVWFSVVLEPTTSLVGASVESFGLKTLLVSEVTQGDDSRCDRGLHGSGVTGVMSVF